MTKKRNDGSRLIFAKDSELRLHRDVLSYSKSLELLKDLHETTPWKQAKLSMFGREVASPRLSAWYGDAPYTYSRLTWPARSWPAYLREVKTAVENLSGAPFNGVLANFYRDGQDSMGWHSDDEPELGSNPIIASYSLGGPRRFVMRRKDDVSEKIELSLPHNSLLVMAGPTQNHWQHAVPKTWKQVEPRINLTFRWIFEA